jgi:hypothetical protein
MHFDLCQAVQAVLTDESAPPWLSIRGQAKLDELRESLAWVRAGITTVVHDDEEVRWWTFGGRRLNAILAANLGADLSAEDCDDYAVRLTRRAEPALLHERAAELAKQSLADFQLRYAEEALDAQKFMDCGGGCWRSGCSRGGRSSGRRVCRSPMCRWRGSEGGSRRERNR